MIVRRESLFNSMVSSIAVTVARKYYDQKRLGASFFFFSRGGGDVGHAGKFVTSIAMHTTYHLSNSVFAKISIRLCHHLNSVKIILYVSWVVLPLIAVHAAVVATLSPSELLSTSLLGHRSLAQEHGTLATLTDYHR
jgi:hypothetical protein